MIKSIEVKGARENNLKNISLNIPRDAITVVTGVSGSGKSSLVFDVIFSEGQRRYLESVGTYARRFTPMLKKPEVDFIFGLSPVLAIEQKKGVRNPRSTVGTMTDISDYLRLLYATLGVASCPYCSCELHPRSTNQIIERLLSLPQGTNVEIYAPTYKIYGEDYSYLFSELRKKGYRKYKIDGKLYDSSRKLSLDENKEYQIDVYIDKFIIKEGIYKQLTDSLENGLLIGERFLRIEISGEKITEDQRNYFYHGFGCTEHHIIVGELLPYYFTPNDSESACNTCRGIGMYRKAQPHLVVENANKSIRQGALTNTFLSVKHPEKYMLLYSLAKHYSFSMDTPFRELPEEAKNIIFYGTKGSRFELIQPPDIGKRLSDAGKMISYNGVINDLDKWYQRAMREGYAETMADFVFRKHMSEQLCPDCEGTRLRKTRMLIRLGGKTIYELGELPLDELNQFLLQLKIPEDKRQIGEPIEKEVLNRLKLLLEIGMDYINLNRRGDSLSGGEAQRIRLSSQISSGLSGMLYVLDEPSIGLHSRDSYRIINTMKKLRDAGNTVIVVEHDMDTIREADNIIEIGPGPGERGGYVMAQGSIEEIIHNPSSLTGDYIAGRKSIPIPEVRRKPTGFISIKGARENNLKNVDVDIPLGVLCCVTGVSGSGKSSLINGILYKKLHSIYRDPRIVPGEHDEITGYESIGNIINIDQSPIGKNSRSNPATYVGFFDRIRELFANTTGAKEMGYEVAHFSSNSKSGRCEECSGNGIITTELQFMPDVETVCPVCKGTGFSKDILEVTYKGKNIAEVLHMSVEEAISFFEDQKYILHKLKVMKELGLGYIRLGQSSSTLSGGEAQRIKLATELSKIKKSIHNLYILDEPTTGLHCADIQCLLDCFDQLVEAGHSVLVVEHHMDVIKYADYVIDVGPEAGKNGGNIVAAGTPEEIILVPDSHTGRFLKKVFEQEVLG
jgi:excinuclease ABC subunit A